MADKPDFADYTVVGRGTPARVVAADYGVGSGYSSSLRRTP